MSRRIASRATAELLAAERDIRAKLDGEPFDFVAMSAVANIYRCGTTIRRHMERTVLADYDLSWVAFTILWVLWIWGEQTSADVASETGVSKATLTGVVRTLVGRGFVRRVAHPDDLRRVSLRLTRAGARTIEELFPQFNAHETLAVGALTEGQQRTLAHLLRTVIAQVDDASD